MWWSVDVVVRQKRGPMGGQTNNRGLYTKECGVTGYDKKGLPLQEYVAGDGLSDGYLFPRGKMSQSQS